MNHEAAVAFGYEEFEDGTWSFQEEREYIGTDGNIAEDPIFMDDGPEVASESPCVDAGDPEVLDPDGTASDIGATGGAYSW
jgi:hypothetical protein